MTQCNALSVRTRQRCTKDALPGMDVCGYHRYQNGAGTSLGIQDGQQIESVRLERFSRALPERMLETLAETARDPELLSMASEIQLLDTRIDDVIKRGEAGESGALWRELRKTYREMQEARRLKKSDDMALKLADLGHLIDRGFADYAVWAEIIPLIEMRRKLAESEQKRLIQLKLVLTYDEAVIYATRLLQAVQKHVPDAEVRNRIVLDIRETIGNYRGLTLPAEA